ncbi:MAG: DUF2062 domain-containing protein [Rhodospirillales bacterium]|nr:DUF2062 domain-containing protein [Rhodospirillales bacterium]
MFKRREKPKLHHRARDFLWPSLGWKRSTEYLFHRIGRLPGTSHTIAAGFACGAAISFTPFVGLHFVFGGFCAWIIRANIVAAIIGTAVGNPWTFPFIWTLIYNLGVWLGAGGNGSAASELDFPTLFSSCMDALLRFDPVFLFETAWPVLWPMFIGGIPAFVVVWFGVYLAFRPLIEKYQSRRREQRMRKIIESKTQETES